MLQTWSRLTFLHWRYDPAVVRSRLPAHLELDTFDGSAWVGLTPFLLTALRPPFLPSFPWLSTFPEMNVRTYVRGRDGERGICFFTLEADRLAAVAGARLTYRLPYRWAAMRVRSKAARVEYVSRRHFWPGAAHIIIARGLPLRADALARFLTARFRLYTTIARRPAFAQVEHPPWPLESATLEKLDQDVIEHSGLPRPAGPPLVHFSPGVDVRIGRPTLLPRLQGSRSGAVSRK
jgi:uncharacterized protein YqjF (DUF2071 family)